MHTGKLKVVAVVILTVGILAYPTSAASFVTCEILKNFYVNFNCIYNKQPFCTNILNYMASVVRGQRNCPFSECNAITFESCVDGSDCPSDSYPSNQKLCGRQQMCCSNPPERCEEIRLAQYNGAIITHRLGFQVVCDSVSDGGGWTVIQRRLDGTTSFDRSWEDYERGFGDINREFWMGFDEILQLLYMGDHEIRFEIKLSNGQRKFVQYKKFTLGGKEDNYRLGIQRWHRHEDSTADGTSIEAHNGMAFTTKDNDNDKCRCLCASNGRGGWWYKRCFLSNLNGQWGARFMSRGPLWISETGLANPLLGTTIKIRRRV